MADDNGVSYEGDDNLDYGGGYEYDGDAVGEADNGDEGGDNADAYAVEGDATLAEDEQQDDQLEDDGPQQHQEEAQEEHQAQANGKGNGITKPPAQQEQGAGKRQPATGPATAVGTGGPAKSTAAGQNEWQKMEIPDEWRPMPLLRVKGVPVSADEDAVRKILEAEGLSVRNIAFESIATTPTKKAAYVRLEPPSDGETDVVNSAHETAKTLKAKDPAPKIDDSSLSFEAGYAEGTLFIANLTTEYDDESTLRAKMDEFGHVMRCFVVCNTKGLSKNYAFVEFSTPTAARKAKHWADQVEQDMRPARAAAPGGDGQRPRWQQVKLLKAEWAHTRNVSQLFGRVLYVANLSLQFDDLTVLRGVFQVHGQVTDAYIPRSKINNQSKGFGFVEFKDSAAADRAYRALDGSEQPKLGGKLLVSFANPCKHQDKAPQPSGAARPSGATGIQSRGGPGQQQGGNRGGAGQQQQQQRGGRGTGMLGGRGAAGGQGAVPMPPGPMGMAGRGRGMMGRGMPMPMPMMAQDPQAMMMQQAMMQQAAAMQMRMQQAAAMQMRAQQAAMAMQLRQQQQAALAMQQKMQQLQAEKAAQQLKLKQEAEARRKAEDTLQRQRKSSAGFGAFGYGVGAGTGMGMGGFWHRRNGIRQRRHWGHGHIGVWHGDFRNGHGQWHVRWRWHGQRRHEWHGRHGRGVRHGRRQ